MRATSIKLGYIKLSTNFKTKKTYGVIFAINVLASLCIA